jgi:signal transduction histidine kinase
MTITAADADAATSALGAPPIHGGLSSAHIAALAAASCGGVFGGVTLLKPGELRIEAAHGFDLGSPPPVATHCERVLRERRLVVVRGGSSGCALPSGPEDGGGVPTLSMFIGAPITDHAGEPLGVLWAADGQPGLLPPANAGELLTAMANQVALCGEVEQARLQYDRALSLVGEAAFRCDGNGVIAWVSPSWATLTGHTVDTTVRQPLSRFLDSDLGNLISDPLGDTDDAPMRRVECSLLTASGDGIPVELAVTRFPSPDTGACGLLGVVTDLRARRQRALEDRHDQKLESLGRLSAGIAHEINTPIQFVGDNTRFLAEAYQEMLALLLVYRGCMDASSGGLSWEERRERATAGEQKADIDYLTTEVPVAVAQSLEGIERVASLVRAMKSFSYKDSSDRSYADLNEALTTTLTVARNEVKYVADVVLDLGDLPEVLCHVGDLNQVFLNLLVNAADALEDKEERGQIRITTRAEDSMAVISIVDNGCGMPPELQRVIFEPFFTTKEVGKGTGQGLPLVRAVVIDKHGGTIEVNSEVGLGTEFVLRLPVDGRRSNGA